MREATTYKDCNFKIENNLAGQRWCTPIFNPSTREAGRSL